MSKDPVAAYTDELSKCPLCDAVVRPNTRQCWLCGHTIVDDVESLPSSSQQEPVSFAPASLLLTLALCIVLLGSFLWDMGLGILASILMVPVFIRTYIVVRKREAAGLPVNQGKKIILAIGSFATMLTTMIIVGIASVATFCGVCLGAYALEAGDLSVVFALCATAGVVLTILFFAGRFMIHRFRTDTTRP